MDKMENTMKKLICVLAALTVLAGGLTSSAGIKAGAAASNYLFGPLDYFVGSVPQGATAAETNLAVRNLVAADAGIFRKITASSVVDKNVMIPRSQQYYQPGVAGGICNKAAAMMVLSFYRDGKGFTALPGDETMFAEISAVYDSITLAYPGFFTNKLVNSLLDVRHGYEMLGSFEAGLAYYLYSKGYTDAAQNVLDNMACAIAAARGRTGNTLLAAVVSYFSGWLSEKTNGGLTMPVSIRQAPGDVIERSLRQGEPVIIGCMLAAGNDIYWVHYFVGVSLYETKAVFGNGKLAGKLAKQYIEVYNTWDSTSSVVDWTVFKNTALYSSVSAADLAG